MSAFAKKKFTSKLAFDSLRATITVSVKLQFFVESLTVSVDLKFSVELNSFSDANSSGYTQANRD